VQNSTISNSKAQASSSEEVEDATEEEDSVSRIIEDNPEELAKRHKLEQLKKEIKSMKV